MTDQLLSAIVTNAGVLVNLFTYSYDPAGNRLTEQIGASHYTAAYNTLNQITTGTAPGVTRANEWDARDRLVAVNIGNQRTEFTYDGQSRRVAIRHLVDGAEVSFRRLVWSGGGICEERDASGTVTKRYFPQGVKVETGPNAGNYFYTRDHLGSIRELTDSGGNVRARYAYDPYGRRTKLTGDLEADFGFAGMFWSPEANLSLTHFRAYDPELGRWLSRDPLKNAEMRQGPNLYAYVHNNPINFIDPQGLAKTTVDAWCEQNPAECAKLATLLGGPAAEAARRASQMSPNASVAFANTAQACQPVAQVAPRIVQTVDSVAPVAEAVLPLSRSIPGLETAIRPFINTLPQRTALQNTLLAPQTRDATLANREAAWAWFHRMNEAGRGARELLPSVEDKAADLDLLYRMQELLFFGPFGP